MALGLLMLAGGCATADEIDTLQEEEADDELLEDSDTNISAQLVSNSLEGVWDGKIVRLSATELPNEDDLPSSEVLLLNCGKSPEIWTKTEDSKYSPFGGEYEVISKLGNHLISNIRNGSGWVETQSWGLISINNNRVYVQWQRMVSNPFAEEDDDSRVFGQFGFGELERISMDCDIWKKKDSADD